MVTYFYKWAKTLIVPIDRLKYCNQTLSSGHGLILNSFGNMVYFLRSLFLNLIICSFAGEVNLTFFI